MSAKIATCCYCGARSVLVFDRQRHELACANCGAPLHEMKAIPQPKAVVKPRARAATVPIKGMPVRGRRKQRNGEEDRGKVQRPKRKRKPLARRMLEEIWDVVEDIFD